MVSEVYTVFTAIDKGLHREEVRKTLLEGDILRKTSFETRRKIADAINHRYLWPTANWLVHCLAEATRHGVRLPASLTPEFDIRTIDALAATQAVINEFGGENIVNSIENPMPGSNPEVDLGAMWVAALVAAARI